MNDSISRKELKLWVEQCDEDEWMHPGFIKVKRLLTKLEKMQSAQQWIPIKTRPMTEEERWNFEEHCGVQLDDEDAVFFDCPMPDEGQRIWVQTKNGYIFDDVCDGSDDFIGLEGNGDWDDIVAWMPMFIPDKYEGAE